MMQSTQSRQEQGSGRVIPGMAWGIKTLKALHLAQRGFTLVELLAVMAIIGILAGVVAGAVGGLGATGVNAQIISDTKTIETSADRFFNDSFPQVYPALPLERDSFGEINDPLVADANDLGVFLIDFDARLPQDPTKVFIPDFIKDIPDSAKLVSYRIDTNTGNVFAAADGSQLIRPSADRLNVFTGDRTKVPPGGSTETSDASDYSFEILMKKNEAAPEIVTMEIPAGYGLGGSSVAKDTVMGTLKIGYSTDNIWDPGQIITIQVPILATGEADTWTVAVDYDVNESTGANDNVDVKNEVGADPNDLRVHTLRLVAPTDVTPGKITLTMDRETDPDTVLNFAGHIDPAHNEATEAWILVVYAHPQDASGVEIDPCFATGGSPCVPNIFTNPSVNNVYRWLARETTTINVAGVFEGIAGKQSIIIKGATGLAAATLLRYDISLSDGSVGSGSVAVGNDLPLTATAVFDDGSEVAGLPVFWASDPDPSGGTPGAADVGVLSGLVVGEIEGTVTITAIDLQGVSGEFTLTVGPAELLSIEVTPDDPADIDAATFVPQQFLATGTLSDGTVGADLTGTGVVWTITPTDGGVAIDAGTGLVTVPGGSVPTAQDYAITATDSSGVISSIPVILTVISPG